jgi:hypothetical protein
MTVIRNERLLYISGCVNSYALEDGLDCQKYVGTNLNNVLLCDSMEQGPWEANWYLASQEFLRILWNLKFHYHIHNCLPPVPVLWISSGLRHHCVFHNIILCTMRTYKHLTQPPSWRTTPCWINTAAFFLLDMFHS